MPKMTRAEAEKLLDKQIDAFMSNDRERIVEAFDPSDRNLETETPRAAAWLSGGRVGRDSPIHLFGFLCYTEKSEDAYGHFCPSQVARYRILNVDNDFAGILSQPDLIPANFSDRCGGTSTGPITREMLEAFKDVQLKCYFS